MSTNILCKTFFCPTAQNNLSQSSKYRIDRIEDFLFHLLWSWDKKQAIKFFYHKEKAIKQTIHEDYPSEIQTEIETLLNQNSTTEEEPLNTENLEEIGIEEIERVNNRNNTRNEDSNFNEFNLERRYFLNFMRERQNIINPGQIIQNNKSD
jgi:hypothetical protein